MSLAKCQHSWGDWIPAGVLPDGRVEFVRQCTEARCPVTETCVEAQIDKFQLVELSDRLTQAEQMLREMVKSSNEPIQRARLTGKAEGVRLAQSYLREYK